MSNRDHIAWAANNGFDTANPLLGPSNLGRTGSFVDAGPDDHGANFTFNFGELPPGMTLEFVTFYGAAGNEVDAVAAIAAVGAEAYSFGQPGTVPDGRDLGEPNTFIFAFRGIGGSAVVPPKLVEVTPEAGGNCGMVTVLGLGSGFKPGADRAAARAAHVYDRCGDGHRLLRSERDERHRPRLG